MASSRSAKSQGRAAARSRRSLQPRAERDRALPLGPIKTIHVFWLAGMSCDGCTIAVAGATNPGIEGLLAGAVPAMPKVILHHPVLSVEAGAEFVQSFSDAAAGKLGAPYVVVFEGSVADERIAARTGGYFSAMGVEAIDGRRRGRAGADGDVAAAAGARRRGRRSPSEPAPRGAASRRPRATPPAP